ncbi:hypothetical protein GCM10010245_61760 [Streptomyces spectabilis]|nr:hypothetical protein GCM10010245_61760 [Streptomyces spectabilis]
MRTVIPAASASSSMRYSRTGGVLPPVPAAAVVPSVTASAPSPATPAAYAQARALPSVTFPRSPLPISTELLYAPIVPAITGRVMGLREAAAWPNASGYATRRTSTSGWR